MDESRLMEDKQIVSPEMKRVEEFEKLLPLKPNVDEYESVENRHIQVDVDSYSPPTTDTSKLILQCGEDILTVLASVDRITNLDMARELILEIVARCFEKCVYEDDEDIYSYLLELNDMTLLRDNSMGGAVSEVCLSNSSESKEESISTKNENLTFETIYRKFGKLKSLSRPRLSDDELKYLEKHLKHCFETDLMRKEVPNTKDKQAAFTTLDSGTILLNENVLHLPSVLDDQELGDIHSQRESSCQLQERISSLVPPPLEITIHEETLVDISDQLISQNQYIDPFLPSDRNDMTLLKENLNNSIDTFRVISETCSSTSTNAKEEDLQESTSTTNGNLLFEAINLERVESSSVSIPSEETLQQLEDILDGITETDLADKEVQNNKLEQASFIFIDSDEILSNENVSNLPSASGKELCNLHSQRENRCTFQEGISSLTPRPLEITIHEEALVEVSEQLIDQHQEPICSKSLEDNEKLYCETSLREISSHQLASLALDDTDKISPSLIKFPSDIIDESNEHRLFQDRLSLKMAEGDCTFPFSDLKISDDNVENLFSECEDPSELVNIKDIDFEMCKDSCIEEHDLDTFEEDCLNSLEENFHLPPMKTDDFMSDSPFQNKDSEILELNGNILERKMFEVKEHVEASIEKSQREEEDFPSFETQTEKGTSVMSSPLLTPSKMPLSKEKIYSEKEFKEILETQQLAYGERLAKMEKELEAIQQNWLKEKSEYQNKIANLNPQAIVRDAMEHIVSETSTFKSEFELAKLELMRVGVSLHNDADESLKTINNVKDAFDNLDSRSTRAKNDMVMHKNNDQSLRQRVSEQQHNIDDQEQKYDILKNKSQDKIAETNMEFLESQSWLESEKYLLKVAISKKETETKSLTKQLEIKEKENNDLETFCNELRLKINKN